MKYKTEWDLTHIYKGEPKKETAKENPLLISGWRTIENGVLTDHTGKGALIAIYKNIIA